jgi:hypothetical protein
MTDPEPYARPYIDTTTGTTVMRTDEQVAAAVAGRYRKILPGEKVTPVVNPEVEIVPDPIHLRATGEAADTTPVDPHRPNPTLEVRERINL